MSKSVKCQRCGEGPCAYSSHRTKFSNCLVLKREVGMPHRLELDNEIPVRFDVQPGRYGETGLGVVTGVKVRPAHESMHGPKNRGRPPRKLQKLREEMAREGGYE